MRGPTLLLIVLLSTAQSQDCNRITVDPASGLFVDGAGRVRVFHGVNMVQKSFPWHPSFGDFNAMDSVNAEDISNLGRWGFNAVRLGVMWHGVEPTEGQYNQTYLQVMRTLVDTLHAQGIYTIIDFHQDIIAERWCGEGVPAWLINQFTGIQTDCNGRIWPYSFIRCIIHPDHNVFRRYTQPY